MSIPPLTGSFGPSGLWIGLLGYLILSRLWGHFSRLMESRADDQAKRHSAGQAESADPAGSALEQNLIYAGALEKLYRHNLVPAVLPGRGLSHPNLYDRLTAAGVKPSFPRPAAPPRGPLALATGLALAGLIAALKLVVYLESS